MRHQVCEVEEESLETFCHALRDVSSIIQARQSRPCTSLYQSVCVTRE